MPVNYQNAKIYTIRNTENADIYVGSTAQKLLSSRMTTHRRDATQLDRTSRLYVAMRTIGIDHFTIILDHIFPCNSKDELEAEEYATIQKFITAGNELYNMRRAPDDLDEEAKKKMAAALVGRFGADAQRFNYGCQTFNKPSQSWQLLWQVDGKRKTKSFAANKYGFWSAKQMAEDLRKSIYPLWVKDPFEDVWDTLAQIERTAFD